MLNCTSRKQVDRVREEFFSKYPDAVDAELADPIEMAELIALLGFKNKRTNTIKRFSNDWMTLEWSEPSELYGIGKYGQDSWELFQKGNLAVSPNDGVLNTYLDWAKTQTIKPV
jgi:methyl-CpG-binding domain protein 4